jgi:acyl-homoserine lactone acylase PvdQ
VLAGLLALTAAAQTPPVPPLPFATVYRDVHGMPHIVAGDERLAWYALGYEQARDALLWGASGSRVGS